MAAIFVSHSSLDVASSRSVKSWLDRQGYENVFLDFHDSDGVSLGDDWEKRLYEEIARCHAVVLIITPNWLSSKWCFAEFTQARALGKQIFPIVATPEGEQLLGTELGQIQFERWDKKGKTQLRQRLQEISAEIARGFAWDGTRPPFPGISAFEADDAAVFFGRDEEVRDICERLEARRVQGGPRLLLILGASGSGKSSLMKAGVLPLLGREPDRWIGLPPLRAGRTPMTALAECLVRAVGVENSRDDFQAELCADPARTLAEVARKLRQASGAQAMPILAIDQFEEVFTEAEASEQTDFLKVLSVLADQASGLPFLVLATMRSDLLGEALKHEGFDSPFQDYALRPMPHERIAKIIEGPAQVAALNLEDGLSARITEDVVSSDSLPLLAFALRELNERHGGDNKLKIQDYVSLGDAKAGLSPIENAVRRKAEDVLAFARPSVEEHMALREAFVGHLVRISEDGTLLRRAALLDALPDKSHRLIHDLVAARLLTARTSDDEPQQSGSENFSAEPNVTEGAVNHTKARNSTIEVSHEALFSAWPLMRDWLQGEKEFLTTRRQIEEQQRIWTDASRNDKSKALLQGLLFEKSRSWFTTHPDRLSAHADYIQASIAAFESERRRKEHHRRVITFASIAASAVLFIAAVFSFQQMRRADTAAQLAEQKALEANDARAEAERAVAELVSYGTSDTAYDLDIHALQHKLWTAGCYLGYIDGIPGPETSDGLERALGTEARQEFEDALARYSKTREPEILRDVSNKLINLLAETCDPPVEVRAHTDGTYLVRGYINRLRGRFSPGERTARIILNQPQEQTLNTIIFDSAGTVEKIQMVNEDRSYDHQVSKVDIRDFYKFRDIPNGDIELLITKRGEALNVYTLVIINSQ